MNLLYLSLIAIFMASIGLVNASEDSMLDMEHDLRSFGYVVNWSGDDSFNAQRHQVMFSVNDTTNTVTFVLPFNKSMVEARKNQTLNDSIVESLNITGYFNYTINKYNITATRNVEEVSLATIFATRTTLLWELAMDDVAYYFDW